MQEVTIIAVIIAQFLFVLTWFYVTVKGGATGGQPGGQPQILQRLITYSGKARQKGDTRGKRKS